MNTHVLAHIEETIQSLAAPEQADSRDALRAAREQERAEREQW